MTRVTGPATLRIIFVFFSEGKYSKLCELCDDVNQCKYYGTADAEKRALQCVTQKGAQIAYTTAEAVEQLVKEQPEVGSQIKILCRNGETRDVGTTIEDDCTWRNQPWTLILSKK